MIAASALADPNVAFLLLVVGALGLLWESHAPGMFAPGIVGALLVCLGAYGFYQDRPDWYGVTLIAIAVLLLMLELKYYTHMVSGIAGTILLAFGATMILEGPRRVSPVLAIAVSLALGIITIFLGLLGMRARKGKHVMGKESLVGKMGVSRTEIIPDHERPDVSRCDDTKPGGMVFVQGEYWQARSDRKIAAGQRVSVEGVQDLIVYVREA